MSEAEKTSFFSHSSQRAPGKRQIKPTAAMAELVLPADDSEDDEDFKGEEIGDSDESESSSEEEEEGGEDEEKDDDIDDYLSNIASKDTNQPPVCSLCLNLHTLYANEEVLQCDRCGVAVHEQCYQGDAVDDEQSTQSSSTTEPWFCEPCTYGVVDPPHCELCPGRYGAFKKSDIGGRWVHLLCALVTPGVTFGHVEHLTCVSWQEVDFRNFGRRACSGCTDRLEARTGIVIQCDAALCKHFYHAPCAQRLGLLSERVSNDEDNDPSRLIHCKKHSREEEVRKRKEAYARYLRQEELRMASLRRKVLSDREEEKRKKQLDRAKKAHAAMIGVTIGWPDVGMNQERKFRRARLLHTSPQYLDGFADKSQWFLDVARDQFEKPFVTIQVESIPYLTPGFSPEFFAYFDHREKHVIPTEKARLERKTTANAELKEKQNELEKEHKELELKSQSVHAELLAKQEEMRKLHALLVKIGVKKPPKLPEMNVQNVTPKKRRGRPPSRVSVTSPPPTTPVVTPKKATLHKCDTCKSQADQHLIIECDCCHNFYHLGCLDPPLERMPKKVKFEWYCSNCNESDEEEAVGASVSPELGGLSDDDNSNQGRRLRVRSDSVRARKLLEAEDQKRAYRAAMSRSGARRPRGSKALMLARAQAKLNGSTTPSDTTTAEAPPSLIQKEIRKRRSVDQQLIINTAVDEMSPLMSTRSSFTRSPPISPPLTKRGRGSLRPSASRQKMLRNLRSALLEVGNDDDDREEEEKIVIIKG